MQMTEEEYQELIKGRKAAQKKPPKYRNRKVTITDPKTGEEITFDSQKECDYYFELLAREKAGEICRIKRQVEFLIQEGFTDQKGKKYRPIKYIADFCFVEIKEKKIGTENGIIKENEYIPHFVDVKGGKATQTAVYKLKRKMLAYRGVIIEEV